MTCHGDRRAKGDDARSERGATPEEDATLAAELGYFLETRTQEQIHEQFTALGPSAHSATPTPAERNAEASELPSPAP